MRRLLRWLRGVVLVEVTGTSMSPTLHPGDRLVAVARRRYRPGDVVVARDPRGDEDGRRLVKRVAGVGPAGLELRGDDPEASTDSRHFGPVDPDLVVGKVVYRYWPPGAGRWVSLTGSVGYRPRSRA